MTYNWNNTTSLDYNNLGARVRDDQLFISILLPDLSPEVYEIEAVVVAETDFFKSEEHRVFPLDFQEPELWHTQINLDASWAPQTTPQTTPQKTYLYWYRVHNRSTKVVYDLNVDPFAREFGFGKFSAFTIGLESPPAKVEIPEELKLEQVVLYEINIMEFGGSIQGCIDRLDYLMDLGVNCILVMPVHNIPDQVNWGYLPLGYFGINERFGNRRDFQEFVRECHRREIRVVLDVVFAHTSQEILYHRLYSEINIPSPLSVSGSPNQWGGININYESSEKRVDALPFATRFVQAVIASLAENFDIDGFRFDWVAGYWPTYIDIVSFAKSVFTTKQPILLAELLGKPAAQVALSDSVSNCCYQNDTYECSTALARSTREGMEEPDAAKLYDLGLMRYSADSFQGEPGKLALQYIENHDHRRFVCNFYGDRDKDFDFILENVESTGRCRNEHWSRVQPYLFGMLLSKGIPMLWQGQELCESHWMTEALEGNASISRVKVFRDVRWEYCFDEPGRTIREKVKKCLAMRAKYPEVFCYGGYCFHNDYEKYQSKGLLLFSRSSADRHFLVALNFTDQSQWVELPGFARAESVWGDEDRVSNAGHIEVRSNYAEVMEMFAVRDAG